MYLESASRVPGAKLWSREPVDGGDRDQAILPDGCIDLIWLDGQLLVAGPDTVAQQATIRAASRYRAIRLPPGMGPAVLGIPAHEIRDGRPPLVQLWPVGAVRRWADPLSAAPPREQYLLLERLVAGQLAQRPVPPVTSAIANAIARGVAVTDIAESIGWNERRLHRHAVEPSATARRRCAGSCASVGPSGRPTPARRWRTSPRQPATPTTRTWPERHGPSRARHCRG